MLRSMTGFGRADRQNERLAVVAEARSVNGRFLKLQLRVPHLARAIEGQLEARVRDRLRRGNVNVELQLKRLAASGAVGIDEDVVRAYQTAFRRLGLNEESLPLLPGVVTNEASALLADDEVALVEATLDAALQDLEGMRRREGEALGAALTAILDRVAELGRSVREKAPLVVARQQDRLRERVQKLLEGATVPADDAGLAREVALIADRADVTEEVDRLEAHVAHARELIASDEAVGRNLDFLAQELHREVNTIGSKSADTEIARLVIELKLEVEKLREQVANIE